MNILLNKYKKGKGGLWVGLTSASLGAPFLYSYHPLSFHDFYLFFLFFLSLSHKEKSFSFYFHFPFFDLLQGFRFYSIKSPPPSLFFLFQDRNFLHRRRNRDQWLLRWLLGWVWLVF